MTNREQLRRYLTNTNTTQRAFAKRVKCDEAELSRYLNGSTPGLERATAIERETDGLVRASGWIRRTA